MLLGVVGCQADKTPFDKKQTELESHVVEEESTTSVDLKSIPLTLIESHQDYLMANNVEFLFPESAPRSLSETWFRSIEYLPNQRSIYYLDGSELIKQDSAQVQSLGEVDYDDYSMISYGIDGETVLYSTTSQDENNNDVFDLYIRNSNYPFMRVASHTKFFDFSKKGDLLFYITNQSEVIQYDVASQSEKNIAKGYERLYYLNETGVLLLQKSDGTVDLYDEGKIIDFANHMEIINEQFIQTNKDYIYFLDNQNLNSALTNLTILLNEEKDLDISGNLSRYSCENQTIERISDKSIKEYGVNKDTLYLLTTDGQLYSTKDNQNFKLISDKVNHLMVNDDSVFYLTEQAELVEVQDENVSTIATQVDMDKKNLIDNSIKQDDLVYLTNSDELMINGEKFEFLCESAVYENGVVIALTTEDEIYYINPKTQEDLLVLEDTVAYDEIYAGNQLLTYREFQYENEEESGTSQNEERDDSSDSSPLNQMEQLESLAQGKQLSSSFKEMYFNNPNGYIMPDSLNTYLSATELSSYTKDELALIRNEIFAQYGYIFDSEFYKAYFESKNWYTPKSKNVVLDPIAKMNVDLIQSLENGGISVEDETLNGLTATAAYQIIMNAYPTYIPISYAGITENINWNTLENEPAFLFVFQSTEFESDNFYTAWVFADGSYQMKHSPMTY